MVLVLVWIFYVFMTWCRPGPGPGGLSTRLAISAASPAIAWAASTLSGQPGRSTPPLQHWAGRENTAYHCRHSLITVSREIFLSCFHESPAVFPLNWHCPGQFCFATLFSSMFATRCPAQSRREMSVAPCSISAVRSAACLGVGPPRACAARRPSVSCAAAAARSAGFSQGMSDICVTTSPGPSLPPHRAPTKQSTMNQ